MTESTVSRPVESVASTANSGAQHIADRFLPPALADKLKQARNRSGMEGERRVVTMLFCDVKGSTAAAERLDPEEWTEVINGAFEYMIRPVYKYEGTVARLMGDSILAFFGAPIAHEDDAERAVRAGLEIIEGITSFRRKIDERYDVEIDVRVGINTGEVVVGAVGSDLRMEYTAIGDAINLASRMEQSALPGTVQIARDTYKLIEPLFDFEALGGLLVKGKEKPVEAYRVLGPKLDPGRLRGIEGVEGKLVGRDDELGSLREVLLDAQQGIGRIVNVVGEAGVGKSRLLQEAEAFWQGNGAPEVREQSGLIWYKVSSRAYESSHPFAAWKRLTRLVGDIPNEVSREGMVSGFSGLASVLPEDEQSDLLQALEALFGLTAEGERPALEGETFRRTLFRSMAQLWQCRHAEQPAVIVFDDLHWCDPASIDMLLHLLPVIGATPIILICAFRPDRNAPSRLFQATADADFYHRYIEIGLDNLSAEECDRLLEHLLGTSDLPDALRKSIWDRTSGNPFFIEEVVRSLIDDGALVADNDGQEGGARRVYRAAANVGNLSIPDNLQALLSARLDRLDQESRRTLDLASVIGRSFNAALLNTVAGLDSKNGSGVDRHLNDLLKRGMIQELSRYPEMEYSFSNPLLQESAYKTILHKRRRHYHQLVAESIESIYSEQLDEWLPRLAFHYSEAHDPRAIDYHLQIGDSAFDLYANREAVSHYWGALQLALAQEQVDSVQIDHLFRRRGRALELDGRFADALDNYQEMELAGQRRTIPHLELGALVLQGVIRANVNDQYEPAEAERLSERALPMARALEDESAQAKIYWSLLNAYRFTGRVAEAQEAGERAIVLARRLGLQEQLAFALNDITHVYQDQRNGPARLAALLESTALWRALDNKPMLADALGNASGVYAWSGAFDESIAASDEAFAISQSIDNMWGMSYSRFSIPFVLFERGEIDRAMRAAEACIHYGRLAGFKITEIVPAILALLYAELGDLEQARQVVDEVMGLPELASSVYGNTAIAADAWLHALVGEFDLAQGLLAGIDVGPSGNWYVAVYALRAKLTLDMARAEWIKAEAVVSQLLELFQELDMELPRPETMLAYSKALMGLGRRDEAVKAAQEARESAERMGARWRLWQIAAWQAQLETDPTVAAKLVSEAAAIIRFIAGQIESDDLRSTFLATAAVQSVMEGQPN